MQTQATSATRDGVVIASGYGLKAYVERGHLVVHDGVGADRRTRRYNRATSKLERILVLGQTGFVTLEAMRWVRDVGAALIQLDRDGRAVAMTAPDSPILPALRRAQALATTSQAGLDVARFVLGEKLRGQAAIARELPETVRGITQIDQGVRDLERAEDLPGLLAAELAAASAYWKAWSAVALPFPSAQAQRVPQHWLTFGQRFSALTHTSQQATNPANAILNYLYALLEAETTIACHAVGLDPAIGIFHSDKTGRNSLALDLMEACRPAIDAYVLAWLTQRTMSPRDFMETARGACRLRPAMSGQLAATSIAWSRHIAPVAERVAQILGGSAGVAVTTPLTQGNRRIARAERPGATHGARLKVPALPSACNACGGEMTNGRHRYCEPCRSARFNAGGASARGAAAAVLERLRSEGSDPAHGGEAARKRGAKNAAHQRAVRAWKGAPARPDEVRAFRRDVQPGLRERSIAELADATGLSPHYCSLIRLGKRVPHQRHWPVLAALTDDRRGS